MARWFLVSVLFLALVPSRALPTDSYTDAFTMGIDALYWSIDSNQPLYSVDDANGDVRMSKPVGGSLTFQWVSLNYRCDVLGDFDVSVDFRDAYITRINGMPGNQVQLNASFGGQYFGVVRSDESPGGDNRHVFASPPSTWFGAAATTATQGTLRISRTGVTVSGFFDGTLVYSSNYNDAPVTLWLSLQNNGTTDSTHVTFDNFTVIADTIRCSPPTAVAEIPSASIRVSAFPNPFNPTTTITYSVPVADNIALQIYDVTGTLVRTLVSGRNEAGPHLARWHGDDDGGSRMANGVYIVRLRTSHDVAARKILMLK